LDLDLSVSETDDFIQLVSGEKIVSGSIPLAHRYGGHQFGIWAGQLGDGRAHFLGIYMNRYHMFSGIIAFLLNINTDLLILRYFFVVVEGRVKSGSSS